MIERPAIAEYPAGAHMPLRAIDDFEFVWLLRGQARLTSGDDSATTLVLPPGQLLLIPPGLRHDILWDPTRPSRHGYVHFGPEHFDSAHGSTPRPARLGSPPLAELRVHPMTGDDPLSGLCAYLLWLGRLDDTRWRQHVSGTLRFMLTLFLAGPLPSTDSPLELPPPLMGAVGHLQQQWSQMPLRRIGVGELADAASVSRSYLSRLFRVGFGLSPAPALQRVRCSRAETLLTRTDLSLETVARQCGFADLSHFSHRFSAIHGVSPRAFRTTSRGGPSALDHPGVRRLAHLIWD